MSYTINPFVNACPTLDVDPELLHDTFSRLHKTNKDLKIDNKQLETDRDEIYERLSTTEDDLIELMLLQKKTLSDNSHLTNINVFLEKDVNCLKNKLQKERNIVKQKNEYINQLLSNKRDTKDASTSNVTSFIPNNDLGCNVEHCCSTSEKSSNIHTEARVDFELENTIQQDNENDIYHVVDSMLNDDEHVCQENDWASNESHENRWDSWQQYIINSSS